jgi:hypothetical protein
MLVTMPTDMDEEKKISLDIAGMMVYGESSPAV